jgi:hypothetical protein
VDAPGPDDRQLTFDLLAASIRADAVDRHAFLEAFALKMSEALPGSVRIDRQTTLFGRSAPVRSIRLDLDERRYELVQASSGLECHLAHRVRDVTLKTESLPIDEWIDSLSRHLLTHAEQSARVRKVLEDMVK